MRRNPYNISAVAKTYRIGPFRLETGHRILERDGSLVAIPPKAVDTLIALVEHAGEIVDKDTLLRTVWPDTHVAESGLTKNICLLRKVLDEPGQESMIQTLSKRGYRFIGEVIEEQPVLATADHRPRRRFVVAAGLMSIAAAAFWSRSGRVSVHGLSEADRLYRIGRHMWTRFDRTEVVRALKYFEKASEADPRSALAYAGIADARVLMVVLGVRGPSELQQARSAALRAVELDGDLAVPHVSLGWVHAVAELDVRAGEREYKRALSLDPQWAPAWLMYSCLLAHSGRLQEARAAIQQAQRIDPVSPAIGVQAARIEYYDRRFSRAVELLQDVLEREPSFGEAHYFMAMSLGQMGRTAEAREALRRARPHASLLATDEAWLAALEGQREPALVLIDERRAMPLNASSKATVLLMPAIAAGEKELALECLERLWEDRRVELLLARVSPRFDLLRSDPRFLAIVRKVWPET